MPPTLPTRQSAFDGFAILSQSNYSAEPGENVVELRMGWNVKDEDALGAYHLKRDFSKTPEPDGSKLEAHEAPIFVVQKHDASHLHYDLRIEIGGVLKSWAVPKGPSMDPKVKRLAIPTEDHPLDYARFEGLIPEGEYGAGTVMVWDIGTFRNMLAEAEAPLTMEQSFEAGRLEVHLEGKKLRGRFVMIRTQRGGGKPQWLIWKSKDEFAKSDADILIDAPDSALTGRSLEKIAKDESGNGPLKCAKKGTV